MNSAIRAQCDYIKELRMLKQNKTAPQMFKCFVESTGWYSKRKAFSILKYYMQRQRRIKQLDKYFVGAKHRRKYLQNPFDELRRLSHVNYLKRLKDEEVKFRA